ARRIAKIVGAPFVKVEATKFTEVGYVGRDVDSMVRDLVEASIRLLKEEKTKLMHDKLENLTTNRLIDILLPMRKKKGEEDDPSQRREAIKADLESGKIEDLPIEVEVEDKPSGMNVEMPGQPEIMIGDIFGGMMPKRTKRRKMPVKDARKVISQQELSKLLDMDSITHEALERAEQNGIIFIDEIDKIASSSSAGRGPDVSREGVQRDILPLVEGCTVTTKYGPVKTDYILFIAAGAFHLSKISDLIPELQGRFPLHVELSALGERELKDILTRTNNALLHQYQAMLAVDNVDLVFTDEAIDLIAHYAFEENEVKENIGARRLTSVMERLLDDLSFAATKEEPRRTVTVDEAYVREHLGQTEADKNLRKYIL
ncbi:MAG: ATP-dependent protease ATPase subunit HslU, partial [Clostridia bacterium]|nr:ATP-dependent protease ATPase subunit HslU [Clostridia bacterium]